MDDTQVGDIIYNVETRKIGIVDEVCDSIITCRFLGNERKSSLTLPLVYPLTHNQEEFTTKLCIEVLEKLTGKEVRLNEKK